MFVLEVGDIGEVAGEVGLVVVEEGVAVDMTIF